MCKGASYAAVYAIVWSPAYSLSYGWFFRIFYAEPYYLDKLWKSVC